MKNLQIFLLPTSKQGEDAAFSAIERLSEATVVQLVKGLRTVKPGAMAGGCVIYIHRIHVWHIYLHLVNFYGKCR